MATQKLAQTASKADRHIAPDCRREIEREREMTRSIHEVPSHEARCDVMRLIFLDWTRLDEPIYSGYVFMYTLYTHTCIIYICWSGHR